MSPRQKIGTTCAAGLSIGSSPEQIAKAANIIAPNLDRM
jgi:hypothetical protein